MNPTAEATPTDPQCEHCGQRKSDHCYPGTIDAFRRCVADMPRAGVAPDPRVPLGRYRHYKGGEYLVTGGAFLATGEEDLVLVVYRSVAEGYQAVRTVADFTEMVQHKGKAAGRFEYLGEEVQEGVSGG